MKKISGKVILVDDEIYEKALLKTALQKKNWDVKVEYFSNAQAAIEYLKKTDDEIFMIISDMNMPKLSGLDFKKIIDKDPKLKNRAIPFIFTTNSASKEQVAEAYEYRVQGYFTKAKTLDEQAEMLNIIIRYWMYSKHPNEDEIYIS